MNLLIDIGNTRLKWALENKGKINNSFAIAHQQTDFIQQLKNNWQDLAVPASLAISSVTTDALKNRVIKLAQQLWFEIKIVTVQSSAKAFGVKNSYAQPQKLGVDRWLCLLASHQYYQQAAWIVDCGTAITIDFIDEHGVHGGGLITAGLKLMRNSLLNNTAALNFVEKKPITTLANQTDNAIFNGTLYAATGLIEKVIKRSQVETVLILTGGDAKLIAQHLSLPATIEPDLVLKGLAILVNQRL